MYKLIITIVFFTGLVSAQNKPLSTKKPAPQKAPKEAVSESRVDSFPVEDLSNPDAVYSEPDTLDPEYRIKAKRQFAAYSKKVKTKKGTSRQKLCIQLVHKDSLLNYCINDSILRDPEVSKVLFTREERDTTYMLILVDAFSKPADKPSCDAGKETKLFFVRWNINKRKAVWNQRTVSSCMKGITNMTKNSIADWDGASPLVVNYHRGGTAFVELTFDPEKYKAGMQTTSLFEDKPDE
jgi:hypothetical protein